MGTDLLAGLGRVDGLERVGNEVLELEGLHEVSVPHQTAVKQLQVVGLEHV